MTTSKPLAVLAAAGLLLLGACNSEAETVNAAGDERSSDTLAAVIGQADDLAIAADILGVTGLHNVFDSAAPYTVFAPTDTAFEALELDLESADASAARAAIMREHIVPGYLTREDIVAAVENAGGSVELQTMGSNTLTISGDADMLRIRSSDGSEAELAGPAISGVNGSVFPVDAVLKATPPA